MYKVGIILLITMWACGSGENLSVQELREYILDESNGLYKRNQVNNGLVEVYYQPAELVWARELSELNSVDRILKLKELDSLMYFVTRFSSDEKGQVIPKMDYLSSEGHSNFRLICESDTLQAIDAIAEKSPMASEPGVSILVVFPRKAWRKRCDNLMFYFNDQSFDTGVSEFSFNLAKIEKCANLNL